MTSHKISPCCAARREGSRAAAEQAAAAERATVPERTDVESPRAASGDVEGAVYIPEGTFLMGTDSDEGFPADGEGPIHEVRTEAFYIDRFAVTNAQFAAFVETTGYETEAERYGFSFVFYQFLPEKKAKRAQRVQEAPWWCAIKGACWKWPEGRGSHVANRQDRPVVHVSWRDAAAYAQWAGGRLPTEAEWERAARGGLEQKTYPWGNELTPTGEHRCNIWQGVFPQRNTKADGYLGPAPVNAFEPNGYDLYNVAGNVWEWCADWFSPTYYASAPRDHPTGPAEGEARVMRGGSYLCHRSYCNRYRVAARSANTPDSSTGNLGFRCAWDA